jgi:hypothetical protein
VGVALPDSGAGPLTVLLDGTGSSDPDDDPLAYRWETGDGLTIHGAIAEHTYLRGEFEARLVVDDGRGLTDSSPPIRIVSGNERPVATIAAPVSGASFDAGDVVEYAGEALDAEEGAIPCAQIGWQVIFHHEDHAHPFLGPEQGACAGTFSTMTTGETSADVHYEIRMTATDGGRPGGAAMSLAGEDSVRIFPNTAELTLDTEPVSGLVLALDTVPAPTPRTVRGVVGVVRQVGAPDSQAATDGHTYRWIAWSDGGAREHSIAFPGADTTLTARFGCDVILPVANLEVEARSVGEQHRVHLRWDPVLDACLAEGRDRYRIYAAPDPVPSSLPGDFPHDPPYELVGVTARSEFHYLASTEHRYYLVIGVGTDGIERARGHYGD